MPVLIWRKSYVNLTKPLCLNPWPHPLLAFLGCCAIYICRIQRGCLYYKEYLLSSYWYCLLTSLCITPTLVGVVWTKFTLAPLAPRMSMQLGSGRSIVSLVSLGSSDWFRKGAWLQWCPSEMMSFGSGLFWSQYGESRAEMWRETRSKWQGLSPSSPWHQDLFFSYRR